MALIQCTRKLLAKMDNLEMKKMINKKILIGLAILSLILPACDCFNKASKRETILDQIVNIPNKLVLDIPQLPPLCDEIPNLKKGYAKIFNGKLYYEEEGQGIPLVLINGGPGGTHQGFHPYFSQLKDIARVIYYDQRGTGKSSSDDTGKTYTVRQAVEDLESLRQALKIDKWVVLGWSYGGLLAQCYGLTYPEHCIGLVLIAASTGVSMKIDRQLDHGIISQVEKDAIEKFKEARKTKKLTVAQANYNAGLAGGWKRGCFYKPTNEDLIRRCLYGHGAAPEFEELMRIESDQKIPQSDFLKGEFDDFEIPTLITEAKFDFAWMEPDRIEVMRKNHPHAQFEIFEKSGHIMFADEPEKFFQLLRSFLKKSSKAKIVYKPGNRLQWPKPPSEMTLPEWLVLYQKSITKNCQNAEIWQQLLWAFYSNKKHTDKALEALRRYEELAKTQNPEALQIYGHCINVWRGQLLDDLDRRDEAIQCYKEILQNFKNINKYCPYVDRKWLEDRLKTPFKFE